MAVQREEGPIIKARSFDVRIRNFKTWFPHDVQFTVCRNTGSTYVARVLWDLWFNEDDFK